MAVCGLVFMTKSAVLNTLFNFFLSGLGKKIKNLDAIHFIGKFWCFSHLVINSNFT